MNPPVSAGLTTGSPNIWRVVVLLLRLRWMILISGFKRATNRRKFGMIFIGFLILIFLGFIFFISFALLRFLGSPELGELIGDVSQFIDSTPVLILSGAFAAILVTSFGLLLQALYLAGDMDFLLAAPIPLRAVFFTKLLQAILPNFSLICAFALPVLFGLGASAGYTWLYYPLVVIMMVALALAAAGISSLFVMFVVRIFPARRVAEILGFVGAMASFICSQSGSIAGFEEVSASQANQIITTLKQIDTPWSPLAWAGRGLVQIGGAQWAAGLGLTALALGLSFSIFFIALLISERLYYTGWAGMQSVKRRKKAPRGAKKVRTLPLLAIFIRQIPSNIRAIFVKDSLVLRRDLRNMSQLVTPLIIGIVYAVMLLRGGGEPPPGRGEAPEWFMDVMRNILVYGNVGLSLFVSWMLSARLAGMAFSQEGRQYWLLKTAPVSPTALIVAKYLVAFLPVLAVSWLYLVVIWILQKAQISQLIFALPVVALTIAGNTGVNLTFGIQGANLDWEDPRQMLKASSSCLSSLISFIYLPISLVLFFGPPIAFMAFKLPEFAGQIVGLLIGAVFSLGCAFVPLRFGRKRIPLLGES